MVDFGSEEDNSNSDGLLHRLIRAFKEGDFKELDELFQSSSIRFVDPTLGRQKKSSSPGEPSKSPVFGQREEEASEEKVGEVEEEAVHPNLPVPNSKASMPELVQYAEQASKFCRSHILLEGV